MSVVRTATNTICKGCGTRFDDEFHGFLAIVDQSEGSGLSIDFESEDNHEECEEFNAAM
jgi:hypothetical protein